MRIIILALYMALFVIACGGSSTPSTTKEPADQTKIGVFIDAPVKGLAYTSLPSGKEGTTNEKGEFEYIDGDMVSFNMGSIELGNAIPDKEKTVKVTQLKEAILVAQLLQVLDADADEDKIDVSDIVIPEAIVEAIEKKLKGTDDNTADNEDSTETDNNIISEEQFAAIKLKNPTKLTLQQRTKVVTKEKVLEHIEQQIGEKGLTFSTVNLENQFLIDSNILITMDGVILGFSATGSPMKWFEVAGKSRDDQKAFDIPWEIDNQGKLVVAGSEERCTLSKLAENNLIDVSVICGNKEKGKEEKPLKLLASLIKPKPLSSNDFTGKSFKVSEETTITFRNDGTFNCNDKEICSYEDHPSYKNTVMIIDDSEETKQHTLVLLVEGSIAKGKLLFISFKGDKSIFNDVELYQIADGALKNLFNTKNQDTKKGEDKDANNDKKDSKENKDNDKENSDNNSDSNNSSDPGSQNPTYIPFTQEMISDSTFYSVGNKDDDEGITIFFDANKKGQAWFSLSDSNTSPDVTFDYLIDNEGYIIFSNTKEKGVVSDDTPAIGLLSKTNNAFTTCWGGNAVSDISDFCKDNDMDIWYKTKEGAETALKQREDNDEDENTDDNSDSNDNPNTGTPKPTYIPFTQEVISDKTIFYVSSNGKGTYQFDPSGTGKLQYNGYHETITSPHLTFDWDISEQGNLIFSNVFYGGASISTHQIYSLSKKDTSSLEVCLFASNGSSEGKGNCTKEVWFYNKEEAEGASKE